MNQAIVTVFVDEQVKAANDQVHELRAARQRVERDERLAELWRLRREGWSLPDALQEIDRREMERRSASGGS